jgi:hypothetical protein
MGVFLLAAISTPQQIWGEELKTPSTNSVETKLAPSAILALLE